MTHVKLLQKPEAVGVSSQTINWVAAFLTNRTQRVVVEGKPSDPCHVSSGVPQGSVIGPSLFLVYISL